MNRGDVVLIDFPYSDRAGSKLRPALVVQDDQFNNSRDDTILAAISRTQRFVNTEVLIDIKTADGKSSGLHFTSVVDCALLITVDQSLIHATLGSLSGVLVSEVNQKLKSILGIP